MYEIYNQKTGQKIGFISQVGQVCCANSVDQQKLEAFLRREILVRETETGELEPLLEETMCFLGCQTLRPTETGYLDAALEQLPILTNYNWLYTPTETS